MSISDKAIALRGEPKPKEVKAEKVCKECKQIIPHRRNYERHKALFGLLRPAFYYWPDPDVQEFRPNNTEHLRAWLLVKANWSESEDLKISGQSKKYAMITALAFMNRKRDKVAVDFEELPDGIRAFWPKSVAYNKCSEDQFKKVLTAVTEIVENIIGVSIIQMRENYKRDVAEDVNDE